jgi:hypothetical protein
MVTCLSVIGSDLLDVLLDQGTEGWRLFGNYMMELDIVGRKRRSIKCSGVINGKDSMKMWWNMSKHAKYVNGVLGIGFEEPLKPTRTVMVWAKVGVDVVYMPPAPNGNGVIVFARDDLSGWEEGRAIDAVNSPNVVKFIYEDVICRHGCPQRIVMDGGSEKMDLTKELLENYRIQQTIVSAYHPQANGLVERGHDSIINSLAKYSKQLGDWVEPLALWADRVSVRR